ncbi:MAG: PEP-CTERM sorting domain-containing protein [Cyanobacteria bacterium J06614_10]
MRFKLSLAMAAAASLLFAIAPAKAAVFVFDKDDVGGKLDVGDHANIATTYDTETEVLTWSSTFRRNSVLGSGRLAEGGWLVLSEGGVPSSDVDEYPIFYLDGAEEKVSVYNYDGSVNERSYLNETFLDHTDLTVTRKGNDEITFAFSYDATDINSRTDISPQWKGAGFGDAIGIWFHGVDGLETSYRSDGSLERFTFDKQGWYDIDFDYTKKVPEPGTVAALGLLAATAATTLRKRLG